MRKIFRISFICLLLTACGNTFYKTITTNEALELINNGAVIIDVRSEDEYNEGHIKDAINIPLDIIDTIDYDKDTPIIIYCLSGVRSMEAVNILKDKGFTTLYNLDGGLINWGNELEK